MAFERTGLNQYVQETNAIASAQVITVPGDDNWKVTSLAAFYTTTAVVGNRVPTVMFTNAGGWAFYRLAWNYVQAASKFGELMATKGGVDRAIALNATDNHVFTPLEDLMLAPGDKIVFRDYVNIDVGADTVRLAIGYEVYRWV